MGCPSQAGYSNGESGVTRLVRTVCKSVQEKGCDKSGRFMSFSTDLKDDFEMASVPLKPFLENSFNILCIKRIELNNKLLDAVY